MVKKPVHQNADATGGAEKIYHPSRSKLPYQSKLPQFTVAIFLAIFGQILALSWLFKSFKSGNGSRMSDKKIVILEFKYLLEFKF